MKKQPIYVIKKDRVKYWIAHQSNFTPIPYSLDWGRMSSIEEFLKRLDTEKTDGEYIRLSRVYDALYSFETSKMVGNANRMLDRVFNICKTEREDLNKIIFRESQVA